MYTICKRFSFSASHTLETLPEGHKCRELHGHNYEVEVFLRSDALDEHGFVVDFGDLAQFKREFDKVWDHTHLNDWFPVSPTAEHIAYYLYCLFHGWLPEVVAVKVWETPNCWAMYTC